MSDEEWEDELEVEERHNGNRALVEACKGGFIEVVRVLLTDGRVDASQPYNEALVAATVSGHAKVVRLLLSQPGVSVHDIYETESDEDRPSLLFKAIEGGSAEVARLVLQQPGVDLQDGCHAYRQRSALGYAACCGEVDIMRVFLASGRIKSLGCKKDALLEAVLGDEPAAVRLMLAQPGIHPTSAAHYGQPLLHVAATRNPTAGALQALLDDKRTDPNEVDFGGFTPLRTAVVHRQAHSVAALLADRRIKVNLVHTIDRRHVDREYGYGYDEYDDDNSEFSDEDYDCYGGGRYDDPEEVFENRFRFTPGCSRPRGDEIDQGHPLLHLAAASGVVETVRLLLADPRIDARAKGKDGKPVLWSATKDVHPERQPPISGPAVVAALLADPRVHATDAASAPAFYERALHYSRDFAAQVFSQDPRCCSLLRCPLPESVRPSAGGQKLIVAAVLLQAWRRRLPVIAARTRAFAEE